MANCTQPSAWLWMRIERVNRRRRKLPLTRSPRNAQRIGTCPPAIAYQKTPPPMCQHNTTQHNNNNRPTKSRNVDFTFLPSVDSSRGFTRTHRTRAIYARHIAGFVGRIFFWIFVVLSSSTSGVAVVRSERIRVVHIVNRGGARDTRVHAWYDRTYWTDRSGTARTSLSQRRWWCAAPPHHHHQRRRQHRRRPPTSLSLCGNVGTFDCKRPDILMQRFVFLYGAPSIYLRTYVRYFCSIYSRVGSQFRYYVV